MNAGTKHGSFFKIFHFVGNNKSAEPVYKSGAPTLCIHPHHTDITNKIIWQHSIPSCKNLTEILPFVQMFT